jgi:hypothetical protein
MTTERMKCAECESMILLSTAEANGGLCAQCVKVSPEEREASRAFDASLALGELWRPSEAEISTARTPSSLSGGNWHLEFDYYSDHPELTVAEVCRRVSTGELSVAFLASDSGEHLLVSVNSEYGACEYQNDRESDWRYAYCNENLTSQVPKNLHLPQPCACCGVGLGWYPSRTHMPRTIALQILSAIATPSPSTTLPMVQWLELGDISRYAKGCG